MVQAGLMRKLASLKGVLPGSSEENILHPLKNKSPTVKCAKDEETRLGHDGGESFAAVVGLQRIF